MARLEDLLLVLRHQINAIVDVFLLHDYSIDVLISCKWIGRVDFGFLLVEEVWHPGDVLVLNVLVMNGLHRYVESLEAESLLPGSFIRWL